MNKTIVIILLVLLGLYCLPTLLAIVGAMFGIIVGLIAAVFAIGLTFLVTLGPVLLFIALLWWLIRDTRRQRQY